MKSKPIYNYGKCHICGGRMQEKNIKQDFWIKGRLLVIENLPAGVCGRCGEKVVNSDNGRRVEALINDRKLVRHARKMTVAVIQFSEEVA